MTKWPSPTSIGGQHPAILCSPSAVLVDRHNQTCSLLVSLDPSSITAEPGVQLVSPVTPRRAVGGNLVGGFTALSLLTLKKRFTSCADPITLKSGGRKCTPLKDQPKCY